MVGAQTNFSLLPFYTQDILQSEIKFKQKRQDFKNVCNMKMRENLNNEDDPDLITKKFWSHIKSNSKSCRLLSWSNDQVGLMTKYLTLI